MSNKQFSITKNPILGSDIKFGGKDVVIFSHVDCFDGTVAAFIAVKNVIWQQCKSYEVIYGSYEKEKPNLPKEYETPPIVFIVDYSFNNFNDVVELSKRCERIIWLDHHGTAYDILQNYDLSRLPRNIHITLSSDYSGALLTALFFECGGVYEFLARHIDDHDRHQHSLGECTSVICDLLAMYGVDSFSSVQTVIDTFIIPYLAAYETTPPNEFSRTKAHVVMDAKRQLAEYKNFINMTVSHYVKNAFVTTIKGEEFIAAIGPRNLRGQINAALMAEYNASLTGLLSIEKNKVRVSLRSNNGEAGRIGEKWGGGGHGNAAGCSVDITDISLKYI